MILGFEHNGVYCRMDIRKFVRRPKGQTANGIRKLNNILLYEEAFNQFINALKGDDFEEVRQILANLIDAHTRELSYSGPITNVRMITDDAGDPYLKELLS